jgi:Ca2+-binding RTX toxin-like protein
VVSSTFPGYERLDAGDGGSVLRPSTNSGRVDATSGEGHDRYFGSDGLDYVSAFGGADRVIGGAGNDGLDCGRGQDLAAFGEHDQLNRCETRFMPR